MKNATVSATSSCGLVTIVMSGTGQVQSVEISPSLTGESLQQAIQETTNAAGSSAKKLYADAIRKLADELDLNLPGMDSMLTSLTGGQ